MERNRRKEKESMIEMNLGWEVNHYRLFGNCENKTNMLIVFLGLSKITTCDVIFEVIELLVTIFII